MIIVKRCFSKVSFHYIGYYVKSLGISFKIFGLKGCVSEEVSVVK